MCLLSLMLSMREKLKITVAAAHYEHGLRGGESMRDAAFVEDFCRSRGVKFIVEHGDAGRYAEEHSMSTEEAARILRYDFLRRAAAELGCDKIATAHNCDDNAETVIFNLCRGSGGAGLRGIPPVRGNIVRPLLCCTRDEIEQYLRENDIPHVEDSTNFSDDYSRNIIRHRVMPVLRELNPRFSAAAFRSAELLREDEKFLSEQSEDFIRKNFDGESLDAEKLRRMPEAISSRVIRKLCPEKLSGIHVQEALRLCCGSGLGSADLPGIRLRRDKGRIYFAPAEIKKIPDRELPLGIWTEIPEAGLRIRACIAEKKAEINGLFKTYSFKYEGICGKIFLTGRKPGDNIRPAGRNCTKSLKKLFLEAGYNQQQRDRTLIIRDEKGILAVHGLAVDERTRAARGDRILRIETEIIHEEV